MEPFEAVVKTIKLNEPLIPIVSTVTGEWLKPEEATDTNYWAKQLRSTVFFGKAVQKLIDEHYNLFLELGPGNSTSTLTRQQAAGKPVNIVTSLEKTETEQSAQSILKALGHLWLNGIEPDWKGFYQDETRQKRSDVPTYAFDKKDYWVEAPAKIIAQAAPVFTNEPIIYQQYNNPAPVMRKQELINKVKETLENASGIEMADVTPDMSFIEIGLDSLILTQVALMLKKQFGLPVTFRQLNEELGSLDSVASYLDANLAPEVAQPQIQVQAQPQAQPVQAYAPVALPVYNSAPLVNGTALDLISQQLQLLAMQINLLQGGQVQQAPVAAPAPVVAKEVSPQVAKPAPSPAISLTPSADLTPEEQVEIKKPFGAIARIEKQSASLNDEQQKYLTSVNYPLQR